MSRWTRSFADLSHHYCIDNNARLFLLLPTLLIVQLLVEAGNFSLLRN